MARVTIEDCLEKVDNRFQLVLIASKRARLLARGSESPLSWEDHKPTVQALREVAEGYTNAKVLEEADLPVVPIFKPNLPALDPSFDS